MAQRSADADRSRVISRREFLGGATVAGVGAGLGLQVFVPQATAQHKKELVAVHWGGAGGEANRKYYFEPFTKETGIRVIEEVGPDMAKLKAQSDAGKVLWDVLIDIGGFRMFQGQQMNLLEKIDYDVVKTKDLIDYSVHPYGAGSNVGAEILAYHTQKMGGGKHPKTWAQFWDGKGVPGRRAMHIKAFGNLEMALVADGVPGNKLYPLDIERAFKKLDQIKPAVGVWTTTYDQPIRLLTDGEVDVTPAWNARASAGADKGSPIAIEWNQGFLYYDFFSVPKGAPNKEAAMQFINFALNPDRQAAFSTAYPYGPVNKLAFAKMSKEALERIPSSPRNMEKMYLFDDNWWAPRLSELTERFKLWASR